MVAPLLVALLGIASADRGPEPGRVEVVSAVTQAEAGQPFKVGIRLLPSPGWHTYWMNPGDSGSPTTVEWRLPSGWSAGPIDWPTPERIAIGGIVSYGYAEPEMLLQTLTPPAGSGIVLLKGRVKWLTCTSQVCKPAKGEFALALPISSGPSVRDPVWRDRIAEAATKVPRALKGRPVAARVKGGDVILTIGGTSPLLEKPGTPYFFPDATGMVSHSKPQSFSFGSNGMTARLPLSEDSERPPVRLSGVLKAPAGNRIAGEGDSVHIDVPVANVQENKHE